MFDDRLSKEHFDVNNIKRDQNSYKNILIYYIGYVTIKKDPKIYSLNPLYLNFTNVNGYFEETNGNKHLMLIPTYESKEKIKKHEYLWSKIRCLIRSITKHSDDYDE